MHYTRQYKLGTRNRMLKYERCERVPTCSLKHQRSPLKPHPYYICYPYRTFLSSYITFDFIIIIYPITKVQAQVKKTIEHNSWHSTRKKRKTLIAYVHRHSITRTAQTRFIQNSSYPHHFILPHFWNAHALFYGILYHSTTPHCPIASCTRGADQTVIPSQNIFYLASCNRNGRDFNFLARKEERRVLELRSLFPP